jgi:hypothetical protein
MAQNGNGSNTVVTDKNTPSPTVIMPLFSGGDD